MTEQRGRAAGLAECPSSPRARVRPIRDLAVVAFRQVAYIALQWDRLLYEMYEAPHLAAGASYLEREIPAGYPGRSDMGLRDEGRRPQL